MTDPKPLLRLLDAWNAEDAKSRLAILEEVTAEGFTYADPHSGPIKTRPEFMKFLALFRERLPDGEMTGSAEPVMHNGHVLCPFTISRALGPIRHGTFFADMDTSGKVTRLVGFLE
ncbi:MAG: hypothetical protein ACPGNV_00935 [Mangrovicoccus sp.]